MFELLSYYFFNKKHPNLFTLYEYISFSEYLDLFYIDGDKLIYKIDYSLTFIIKRIYLKKHPSTFIKDAWCIYVEYKDDELQADLFFESFLSPSIVVSQLLDKIGDKYTRNSEYYTNKYIKGIEIKLLNNGVISKFLVNKFVKENRGEVEYIIAPLKDLEFYKRHTFGFLHLNSHALFNISSDSLTNKLGLSITLAVRCDHMSVFKEEISHISDNIKITLPSFKSRLFQIDIGIDSQSITYFNLVIYKSLPIGEHH